jgi:hypothetical protein
VLAAALLGIVAAGVMGALSYAWNLEIRGRQRLAAAEVANRVLISYLDDSTSIRPGKLPPTIGYRGEQYRWREERKRVSIIDANPNGRRGRAGDVTSNDAFEQMVSIRVEAWLDDGSPAAQFPGATPGAAIERLVDPLAFRGVDTIERLLQDPERQTELIGNVTGLGNQGVEP